MGIIQGREEGVAVRGMYPTQQGPAFIRPFMRFLTRLLLLVGLVMLVSSHFFPFFPSFCSKGWSAAGRLSPPMPLWRLPLALHRRTRCSRSWRPEGHLEVRAHVGTLAYAMSKHGRRQA
jgi:hypothetical protein